MSTKPAYGKRLLPTLVDQLAQSDSHGPYAKILKTEDPADGYEDFSYKHFAAAIDFCAHFLDEHLPPVNNDFPVFAYMGAPQDFRYILFQLAAMKSRRVCFLPSPRNSLAAHLSLLEQTNCKHFLVPGPVAPAMVQTLAQKASLKIIPVPSFNEIRQAAHNPYKFEKTFEEVKYDPVMFLHTSGSTGIPKAIKVCHHWMNAMDAHQRLAELGRKPVWYQDMGHQICYSAFPYFHGAGITTMLVFTVFCGWTAIINPTTQPTTPMLIQSIMRATSPTAVSLPPSLIKDMLDDPDTYETLKTASYVNFGGGPLPTETGVKLAAIAHPVNCFGMTEVNAYPWHLVEPTEWEYFSFDTEAGGMDFRQIGPNEYELWIIRNPDFEDMIPLFSVFPHLNEWSTKDIWAQHPNNPNLWAYRGRVDNVIVFSNGEKLNPASMQDIIDSDPHINAGLVFGQGKFQSGLLIELREPITDPAVLSAMVDNIWPTVQRANEDTVAHGRLAKDAIIFTQPDKPFPRTGKGTVQRKMALMDYDADINALYEKLQPSESAKAAPKTITSAPSIDITNKAAVASALHGWIASQFPGIEYRDSDDLFSLGVDSLMAANFARHINSLLGSSEHKAATIYRNPTIEKLTNAVCPSASYSSTAAASVQLSREETMSAMFNSLTADLPVSGRTAQTATSATVFLTGTTGSLGTYLLDDMLSRPSISKVYAFNRSLDAATRQQASFTEKGLTSSLTDGRVTFLTGDLSQPYFGLSLSVYRELLSSVTHIMHNAWPVNFNFALESFEPAVRGVRRLVDFAVCSTYNSSIYFTSTIATAGAYKLGPSVPEIVLPDWSASNAMGYAEAKHVAESILAKASEISGISSTVCRVGQIAGPVRRGEAGVWSKQEWFPSIVASSIVIGALPDSVGMDRCDWVPVDYLGPMLTDLMLANHPVAASGLAGLMSSLTTSTNAEKPTVHVNHAVNPKSSSFTSLVPSILAYAEKTHGQKLEVVPLRSWYERLAKSAQDPERSDLNKNPALKLLGFFDAVSRNSTQGGGANVLLQTDVTTQGSKTMRDMPAVGEDWIKTWLSQWKF